MAEELVWGGNWATPMGPHPYSYSDGRVHLWLGVEPGETFTWLHWSEVLLRFPIYILSNQRKGTQFLVLRDTLGGTKVVAFGQLLAE